MPENLMTIDCPNCGQKFSSEMPKSTMVNTPGFSQLVATHEKPIRCLNSKCNTPMTFALVGAQVQWTAVTITEEAAEQLTGSRIIPALRIAH